MAECVIRSCNNRKKRPNRSQTDWFRN
jgi:hypothetical protein